MESMLTCSLDTILTYSLESMLTRSLDGAQVKVSVEASLSNRSLFKTRGSLILRPLKSELLLLELLVTADLCSVSSSSSSSSVYFFPPSLMTNNMDSISSSKTRVREPWSRGRDRTP